MVISISETALFRSGNRCPERREKHHIVWVLMEYILETSLNGVGHFDGKCDITAPIAGSSVGKGYQEGAE